MDRRPWHAHYSKGVAPDIDINRYSSIGELFESRVHKSPDAPAFTNRNTTLSFAEIDRLSAAFSAFLSTQPHLNRGDRIAVMLPNLLQSPIVILGVLRAGMAVVNVNPQYTPRELRHQLSDSGAKAIVVLENFAATLEAVIAETDVETVIVTSVGDAHPPFKRWLIDTVVRHIKKLVPAWQIGNVVPYRRAISIGSELPKTTLKIEHNDLACLQYTGGTTGVAKGAMLSHKNLVSNVLQLAAWAEPVFEPGKGVVVTPLPLYHIFALTVNMLTFIELGGQNVLITDPRDIGGFIKELKRYPVTFLTGVNTLFNAMLNHPSFRSIDFSLLKVTLAGGMAVQRVVADRWQDVTGCVIAQGYGLTEASPVVSANPMDTKKFNGSIGLPLPSTDVRIYDEGGNTLGTDETGEICVSGPQVMQGYWQRPNETAGVMFPGGWLRTGDIGRIDSEGFVFIEDRKKDMIVVSGFKVFPNEIEEVIAQHPDVIEAAAIGVPDEESGERVKLFIVRSRDDLSEADIRKFCKEHLTGYKRPRDIEFRTELPKSNVGKILRRLLKEGPELSQQQSSEGSP